MLGIRGNDGPAGLVGRSLFALVHASDVLGLRDYASQLSASKNPAGDKVFLNLRLLGPPSLVLATEETKRLCP